jgi:hypothetical protein
LCNPGALVSSISIATSILHDQHEILPGVGNKVEIFQRITVHQYQVRISAFCYNAEPPLRVRITWTAQCQRSIGILKALFALFSESYRNTARP